VALSFLTVSDTITTIMRLEQLQAQRIATPGLERSASMPPCCGAGCAVCVLDYWEPDEFEIPSSYTTDAASDHGYERRPRNNTNELAQSDPRPDTPADLPACCGTGCAVCVLDYPESFSKQRSESETLAMLEAVEQAQRQARRIIANQDGDSLQA
jgi:hypothetical protein